MDPRWTPLTLQDPRIASGMRRQLQAWQARLAEGDRRWGWKVAFNAQPIQAHLGLPGCAVGALTEGRIVASGSHFSIEGMTLAALEPEIAIEISGEVDPDDDVDTLRSAIAGIRPALEIVDVDRPFEDLETILAENIFHRGVVVDAPNSRHADWSGHSYRLTYGNDEQILDPTAVLGQVCDVVRFVATTLRTCGQELRAGDTIISGSMCAPIPAAPGMTVLLDAAPLGRVELSVSA